MAATVDLLDPLNIQDYEPPREKAQAALDAKIGEVVQQREVWVSDLKHLDAANKTEDTLALLKAKAMQSQDAHRAAQTEVHSANDDVQKCWDAL
eukprot:CAMPEP_0173410268 /NCGR_PEP_ID=MMETSP1356-20130122/74242_1 /TAXON_ID=77927 ORGANISM="Hemiselmis virescens, Strain PCC157" /NCGR_SAMPLE_ID=MMETSP1356 /ASSEMBLY_ACC=CAM_ASM_000847 /LENGTH=93 /DNA_ID=CAMNT_0014371875 /DNA_START=1 /DNA_END=279 /DNA_ORIENTATION=+